MTKQVQFQKFCEENPLEFDQEELDKIERDIVAPQKGVVCDEYVEFMLWSKGLRSRQESFAEFVTKLFPAHRCRKILEVGCGKKARLAGDLAKAGYEVTAMDPKVEKLGAVSDGVTRIRTAFDWETMDITAFDVVVAQEPCEATEHIIRACVQSRKNFLISLCAVPHRLLNGEEPQDVYAWYEYLMEIGGQNCIMLQPDLLEGYVSNVMLGLFEADTAKKKC